MATHNHKATIGSFESDRHVADDLALLRRVGRNDIRRVVVRPKAGEKMAHVSFNDDRRSRIVFERDDSISSYYRIDNVLPGGHWSL